MLCNGDYRTYCNQPHLKYAYRRNKKWEWAMSETNEVGAQPNRWRVAARQLASLVGWVWGGFSILTGLMFLAVGPGASQRMIGLSAVCAGLLLIPPVVRFIRQRVAFMRTPGLPTIAAIVVGVAILIVTPWPKPDIGPTAQSTGGGADAQAERRPSRAERQQANQERERDEDQARLRTEVTAMWADLTRITKRCDDASTAASNSLDLSRSNLVHAYQTVQYAQRTCASAGLDVMGISAPRSLDREQRKAFDKGLNDCGMAYMGKSVMFDRMLKVINGDRRPSQLAGVQEAAQASQAQVLQCVLTITALADEQGVALDGTANQASPRPDGRASPAS